MALKFFEDNKKHHKARDIYAAAEIVRDGGYHKIPLKADAWHNEPGV